MIALALALTAAAHAQAPDKAAAERAWQAVQTCQFAIMATLHDPKAAEFPGISRSFRTLEKGVYRTQVEVRARNAFNAMRLVTFECKVSEKTGKLISMRQIT